MAQTVPREDLPILLLPDAQLPEVAPVRRGLLAAPRWQLALKRSIDVSVSTVVLLVFLPVMIVAALAIKVSSSGPVIFAQERIGRQGRPFTMLKLRSMYHGAHYEKPKIVDLNESSGPVFKIRNDPRITAVGRVMRKLSIDELPQLMNVLRGEMSLVGPRPPLPDEVAQYGPWERQRLAVKPGITGIWQVSGRSEIDFDRWVDMDIHYIRSWTPLLDVKLLLRTIPAVVSGRGAY